MSTSYVIKGYVGREEHLAFRDLCLAKMNSLRVISTSPALTKIHTKPQDSPYNILDIKEEYTDLHIWEEQIRSKHSDLYPICKPLANIPNDTNLLVEIGKKFFGYTGTHETPYTFTCKIIEDVNNGEVLCIRHGNFNWQIRLIDMASIGDALPYEFFDLLQRHGYPIGYNAWAEEVRL